MTIAVSWSEFGPASAVFRAGARVARAASRNLRFTAVISVVLIVACFAAATILQMRRDYAHSLAMGATYAEAQAGVLADETGRHLDRLASLATAYVNAVDGNSAAEVILSSHSDRVLNIGLADADGNFIGAMIGRPLAAEPLSEEMLMEVQEGRTIQPYSDPAIGSSPMTLVFAADQEFPPRFIVMPLDPRSLLSESALGETALFTPEGMTLALGQGWEDPPPAYVLRSEGQTEPTLRHVEYDGVRRLIALSPVPGWPLAAVASVRADDVLNTWYSSLPLYLFVILGPAVAGAALAVVLVREFERTDRARSALQVIKALAVEQRQEAPAPEGEARLTERLADAEQRAAEAERAKSEFTAHVSHELCTPLNAVIGFAEMMRDGYFGPVGHAKYAEYAENIASAGRELHGRIAEILEYAALEAGTQALDRRPTEIAPLVSRCLEQAGGLALSRRISLSSELAELPKFQGDGSAIKRILTIILSNALRYTPEGGTVHVEARKEEDTIVLRVRDSGPGFTPEEAARVGEPYLRFSRPGVEESGLGLGLAMAMTLARRMGGALRLAGAAGEGTWAELRLPTS